MGNNGHRGSVRMRLPVESRRNGNEESRSLSAAA